MPSDDFSEPKDERRVGDRCTRASHARGRRTMPSPQTTQAILNFSLGGTLAQISVCMCENGSSGDLDGDGYGGSTTVTAGLHECVFAMTRNQRTTARPSCKSPLERTNCNWVPSMKCDTGVRDRKAFNRGGNANNKKILLEAVSKPRTPCRLRGNSHEPRVAMLKAGCAIRDQKLQIGSSPLNAVIAREIMRPVSLMEFTNPTRVVELERFCAQKIWLVVIGRARSL